MTLAMDRDPAATLDTPSPHVPTGPAAGGAPDRALAPDRTERIEPVRLPAPADATAAAVEQRGRVSRAELRAADDPRGAMHLERQRDRTTFRYLLELARRSWPDAQPVSFDPAWWDGAACSASLVVDSGGRRHRLVAMGNRGTAVLPASALRARHVLAGHRPRPPAGRLLPRHARWSALLGRPVPGLVRFGWWRPAVVVTDAPVTARVSAHATAARDAGQLALFDPPQPGWPYGPPVPPRRVRPPLGRRAAGLPVTRIGLDVPERDHVRCSYHDCGGLRPLAPRHPDGLDCPCPACGRW